MTDTVG